MRVAGWRRASEVGEFGGMGLAHDDRAARPQCANDLGVDGRGCNILARPAARPRGPARHIDHVLYGKRNAVQRTKVFRPQPGGRFVRAIAVDLAPASDLPIDGLDACEIALE